VTAGEWDFYAITIRPLCIIRKAVDSFV